jgi:hypothetical protein
VEGNFDGDLELFARALAEELPVLSDVYGVAIDHDMALLLYDFVLSPDERERVGRRYTELFRARYQRPPSSE